MHSQKIQIVKFKIDYILKSCSSEKYVMKSTLKHRCATNQKNNLFENR